MRKHLEKGDEVVIRSSDPCFAGQIGVIELRDGENYYIQLECGIPIHRYLFEIELINKGKVAESGLLLRS